MDWLPINTAPRDGTVIECLWPGFGQPAGRMHQGDCVYKRDWYALGNKYLELWWTGDEFQNPTARDPTHWRPVSAPGQ